MACAQPFSQSGLRGAAHYLMPLVPLFLAAAAVGQSHDHDHDELRRQAGVHVHGIAQLLVVADRDHLAITLETPAVNVVGFEHNARTDAERERLRAAERALRNADRVAVPAASASCEPESVRISSTQLDALNPHNHEHDHAQDSNHGHSHDDQDGTSHAEFVVDYRFVCNDPLALNRLSVTVFEHFPGFEAVNVQWALPSGQGAQQVDAGRPGIRF